MNGFPTARIAVVAINDPVAVHKIVSTCRSLSHEIIIIVRTRYISEVEALVQPVLTRSLPRSSKRLLRSLQ